MKEEELIEGQIGNILFDAKEGDLVNIPKRIETIIILAKQQGRTQQKIEDLKDEIKFLKGLLQDKNMKRLSEARKKDTGKATIPDLYDRQIKKRIRELKSQLKLKDKGE